MFPSLIPRSFCFCNSVFIQKKLNQGEKVQYEFVSIYVNYLLAISPADKQFQQYLAMLKAIDSVEFNLKTVLLTDVDVEMVQL